jgi:hypothetical protein
MSYSPFFVWLGANLGGRSIQSAPRTGNIVIPMWDRHAAYVYTIASSGISSTNLGINDSNALFDSATGIGFLDCATDAASGIATVTTDDFITYATVAGTSYSYANPISGQIPVRIAYDGTEFDILMASGKVYKTTSLSTGTAPTLTLLGTYPAYASSFEYYNNLLYGTIASSGEFSKMSVSAGTVSSVSTPMTFPSAIAPSSFGDAVIGYDFSSLPHGYTSLASLPTNPGVTAAGVRAGASFVDVMSGTDFGWSVASSIATTAAPAQLAWVPNGEQLLVTETNNVQVFNLTGGALVSSQNLSVSGPTAIGITPDSSEALVCQPGSNSIAVLTSSLGTWSIGTPVTSVADPVSVTMISSTSAAVASSAGAVFLTRLGSVWSVSTTQTLTFNPTSIWYDALSTNTYVVGSSGGSGYLAVVIDGIVTELTNWTGSANSVVTLGNRILVLDETNSQTRLYYVNSIVTATEVIIQPTFVTSPTGLFVTNYNIWQSSATVAEGTNFLGFYGEVARSRFGVLSVYNEGSSTWSSYNFAPEVLPTALLWDFEGHLWVFTSNNVLWLFTATATVTSETTIPAYTDQGAGVPLGVSSIVRQGNVLYCTTSLSGVFLIITGLT